MATSQYIIGNDGTVTIGTEDQMKVKSYAVTLSRPSSDLTAFGDGGKRRRVGLLDCTGSLNGVLMVGTGSGVTTVSSIMFTKTNSWNTSATNTQYCALTLGLFSDGTATAKIVSNVVFNSWAFNSDKNADAGVTANFENGDGSAPVLTWSV